MDVSVERVCSYTKLSIGQHQVYISVLPRFHILLHNYMRTVLRTRYAVVVVADFSYQGVRFKYNLCVLFKSSSIVSPQ